MYIDKSYINISMVIKVSDISTIKNLSNVIFVSDNNMGIRIHKKRTKIKDYHL